MADVARVLSIQVCRATTACTDDSNAWVLLRICKGDTQDFHRRKVHDVRIVQFVRIVDLSYNTTYHTVLEYKRSHGLHGRIVYKVLSIISGCDSLTSRASGDGIRREKQHINETVFKKLLL